MRFQLRNGQALLVRVVTTADAAPMVNFLKQVAGESDFLSFGQGEVGLTVADELAMITKCLHTDNDLFLVAEIEGRIVGNLIFRGGFRVRTRHSGEFGVSVLRDYWGLGIASGLIRALIAWAEQNHWIKKINLKVREDNAGAIRLYRSFGFNEEGRVSRDFCVDGTYYRSILMGLEIN